MSMAELYSDINLKVKTDLSNSEYIQYYNQSVEEGLNAYRAGDLFSNDVATQQAEERRARIMARICCK